MDKVFLYWWFTQYQENKTVALGLQALFQQQWKILWQYYLA